MRLANRIEGGEPAARARAGRRGRARDARGALGEPGQRRRARRHRRARRRDLRAGRRRGAGARPHRAARGPAHRGGRARRGRRRRSPGGGRSPSAPGRPSVRFEQYPAEAVARQRERRRRAARSRASALDFEGTRFLGTAPGDLPQDPIRVFAGVRSADTIEERCRLAVDELERLGAFRRARGSSSAPPRCAATSSRSRSRPRSTSPRGDVASVVVQYFDRRTWLMPAKVPVAARTHRELLRALRERLAARRGPARGRDLRREPRRLGEPERLPRRRRALARRGRGRPARCGSARRSSRCCRGGWRRARWRPTSASASCARRSSSRGRRRRRGLRFVFLAAARTP